MFVLGVILSSKSILEFNGLEGSDAYPQVLFLRWALISDFSVWSEQKIFSVDIHFCS